MVCIIGCLGIFHAELGSGAGHSSQVNHQMTAASQAGSRGEVKGGAEVLKLPISPLGCSPFVLDAALLAPPQLICCKIANGMRNAACRMCCLVSA